MGLLDHIFLFFHFIKMNPKRFLQWLHQLPYLSTVLQASSFSASSTAIVGGVFNTCYYGMRWHFIVVLTCISLIGSSDDYFFLSDLLSIRW